MTGRARAAAALCAAAAAFASPAPALAHEGGLPVEAVVESVVPGSPTLRFETRAGAAPLLFARNAGDEQLVVEGTEGEPYLRIGPGGAAVNLRSPTAYASADPLRERAIPPTADPAAEPRWHTVSSEPEWLWYDIRVRPESEASGAPGEVLRRWTVGATLGDRAIVVTGRTQVVREHGHFRTVIDRIEPPRPELDVRISEGMIPALFVQNDTGEELAVPGHEGEPFLRIGPEGVFANTRSPTYWLAGAAGIRDVPGDASARATPEWKKLQDAPVFGWLLYGARRPEEGAADPARAAQSLPRREGIVTTWRVDATLGGDPLTIAGHVEWVPLAAEEEVPDWPWTALIAVTAAVTLGGGLLFRAAARRAR